MDWGHVLFRERVLVPVAVTTLPTMRALANLRSAGLSIKAMAPIQGFVKLLVKSH
jgi:hypothetical protein